MKKILKRIIVCGLLSAVVWSVYLIRDRRELNNGLIRLHIVAHSDDAEDQELKLKIRDVILESMNVELQKIADIDEAKRYLQENLPKLQRLVDQTLSESGFDAGSRISLCKEQFDIRHYDTFSLPSGVYDSLRIVIGDGIGKNWWCVSFPTLCIPATTSGFADAAVSAGFSDTLVQTLIRQDDYEIRFFFLNQLGKLENILFQE